MLELHIPDREFFDEATSEFVTVKGCMLQLEHSLLSVSKWEAKWHRPFLDGGEKTTEQMLDYINKMIINRPPGDFRVETLTNAQINAISEYIDDSMTATTFNDRGTSSASREIITSELIYYWMVSMSIPFECQKWHLNRLLTLVKVISLKNGPEKKMSKAELAEHNRRLNEERLKKYGTTG